MKISIGILLLLIFILNGINVNAQTPQWAFSVQGPSDINYVSINSMQVDANGNIYVTGDFNPTISFGSHTLVSGGSGIRMFLVKLGPSGNLLWSVTPGIASATVSIDPNGNVYLTGAFPNEVAFGSDTLTGGGNFITKFDSSSNVIWAKKLAYGIAISNDASGNIYIAANDLVNAVNDSSIGLLVKLDSMGDPIWTDTIVGGDISGLATDPAGSSYVTGNFTGSLKLGNIVLSNSGSGQMFLAKFDSSGNNVWGRVAGADSIIYPAEIGLGCCGESYISGYIQGSRGIFGNDTVINTNDSDLVYFIAKYDSSGNSSWEKIINGNGILIEDISTKNQNLYVTGSYTKSIILGDSIFINNDTSIPGIREAFFAEFDSSGTALWEGRTQVNGDKYDGDNYGVTIATDNNGNIYVGGEFIGQNLIMGNDTLTNALGDPYSEAAYALFIAKYDGITTGIANTPNLTTTITVYPNPSTGQFYFKGIPSGSTMEVYDVLGQTIYSSTVTGNNYLLNVAGQAKGMHFYRVVDRSSGVQEGKIILE